MGKDSPPEESHEPLKEKDVKEEKVTEENFVMPDFAYYIEGMRYFDDDD